MWCTSAAMVDDFPPPLMPATISRPRSDSTSRPSSGGRLSDASVGTANGMTRITIMIDERWRRMFTRKRPTPGMPQEQS